MSDEKSNIFTIKSLNSVFIFMFFILLFTIGNNYAISASLLLIISASLLFINIEKFKNIPKQIPVILATAAFLYYINVIVREPINRDTLALSFFLFALIPIYIHLSLSGYNKKAILYGCYGASIIGGYVGFLEHFIQGQPRAHGPYWTIMFGNLGVILFYFSVARIFELIKIKQKLNLELAVCLLAIIGSILITYTSVSRGPIVALIVLGAFFAGYLELWRNNGLIVLVTLFAISYTVFFHYVPQNPLNSRISEAISSVTQYDYSKPGTSNSTVRFDMWKASIAVAAAHPFIGVGRSNLKAEIKDVQNKLNINSFVWAKAAHMHSDFFDLLSKYGVFAPLLYIVFMIYSFKTYHKSRNKIPLSLLVLFYSHLVGFITFGLTDTHIGFTNGTALLFLPIIFFTSYCNSIDLSKNASD